MTSLQPLAAFPGLDQLRSVSYTLSPGISPSVASIEIAPQERFSSAVGTLEFRYGDVQISFPQSCIDSATLAYNSAGMVIRLSLLDRRWKWRFGQISGRYNVWRQTELAWGKSSGQSSDNNELVPESERTPRELCTLCLDAMGERSYDVGRVPNDLRPTVDWNYTVPADALAEVAERVGCIVVLRTDNTVAVLPKGQGRDLPLGSDVTDVSVTLDPPELPDETVVVCSPEQYQADLPLEAVGQDTDGTIRPIDELSYQPTGGWTNCDLEHMNQVEDPKSRELARSTVFRWYRVKQSLGEVFPKKLKLGEVKLEHILPLGNEQLDTQTTDEQESPAAAEVFGRWYSSLRTSDFQNNVDKLKPLGTDDEYRQKALYHGAYEFDASAGLIRFRDPVHRFLDSDGNHLVMPAELRLRTSFGLRDSKTGAARRYERRRRREAEPNGTSPQFLKHDEIAVNWRVRYDSDYRATGADDNLKSVERQADYYLDALEQSWQTSRPQSAGYVGLKSINPDGAIQQVTWSIGLDGATTRAARNTLADMTLPSFEERRALERNHASRGRQVTKARRRGTS